jgi:uncharacterized protein with FMN-binding domain
MGTLAIVLIIVAVILVIIFIFASAGLKKVGKLNIGKIDLSKLADGVYTGEFKGYRWSNQVEVTVKNHQIAGIKIIKDIVFGSGDISKKIFDQIIQKQSLQIDTVSSATVTNKAYLKAIENALLKGK